MDSTKKTARLAGLLYLVSSIPGVFALLYIPGKLVVKGDAAATADRIRNSQSLLRIWGAKPQGARAQAALAAG